MLLQLGRPERLPQRVGLSRDAVDHFHHSGELAAAQVESLQQRHGKPGLFGGAQVLRISRQYALPIRLYGGSNRLEGLVADFLGSRGEGARRHPR